MILDLRSYFRQSFARQGWICFHHGFSEFRSIFSAEDLINLRKSCRTSEMFPTIGTSTLTRLEIDEGSKSMWMVLRRVCQDDAAAGVDQRPLGLEQQLHRLLQLPRVPLARRVVGAQRHRLGIVE